MGRNEWDDLERGFDEAIRSYSGVEPPQGLESRILQSVATRSSRPFFLASRLYAAGAACLCMVLVFAAVITHRRQSKPGPAVPPQLHPSAQEANKAPRSAPLMASSEKARPEAAGRAVRMAARVRTSKPIESNIVPKRVMFPTPAPLTAEERAMRDLTADDYAKVVREFVEFSNRNSEPLHIADIVIKPLDESESR
jgi:hypothetical protein